MPRVHDTPRPRATFGAIRQHGLRLALMALPIMGVACSGLFAPPGGIEAKNPTPGGTGPGGGGNAAVGPGAETENKRPGQIDEAKSLMKDERYLDALQKIQRALLLSPENAEAIALRAQIKDKISSADTLIVIGEAFGGYKPDRVSQLSQLDRDARDMGIKPGYAFAVDLPRTMAIDKITLRADTPYGELVAVEARTPDGAWVVAWTGEPQKLEVTNGAEITLPARPVTDTLRFAVKAPALPTGRVSSVRVQGRVQDEPPEGLLRAAEGNTDLAQADKGGQVLLLRGAGPYKVVRFNLASGDEKVLGTVNEARDLVWAAPTGGQEIVYATTGSGLVKVNPGGNEVVDKRMIGASTVKTESGGTVERTGEARLASMAWSPRSQTVYIGFDSSVWSLKPGEKPRRFGAVTLPPGREGHTVQQLVVRGNTLLIHTAGTCAGKPCGQWWRMSLDGSPLTTPPQPDARLGAALLQATNAKGPSGRLTFNAEFEVQYIGGGSAATGLLRPPFLHSIPIENAASVCAASTRAAHWLGTSGEALALTDACGKAGGLQPFVVQPDTGAAFQLAPVELSRHAGLGDLHLDTTSGWWFAGGHYGNVDGTLWKAPEGRFAAWKQ